jgi:hypothetical protein
MGDDLSEQNIKSNTQLAACVRCKRDLREDEYGFVEWTECAYCTQIVCDECSMLLPEHFESENSFVCLDCWHPFLHKIKEQNASFGEHDAKSNPLGRIIVTGVVETMDEDADYAILRNVKQNGEAYLFASNDYREEPADCCELEIHTAWEHLKGRTVEISCRVVERTEERESPRGNPYWVNTPVLTLIKILKILNEMK